MMTNITRYDCKRNTLSLQTTLQSFINEACSFHWKEHVVCFQTAFWLFFKKYFLACFTHSWRQSCGGIADGNDDDGLFCIRHLEEFMAALGIEVAYPTRTQSLFRCRQTEVLYCNGYIDVAVRLAVFSYPLLLMKQGGKNVQRCFVEPRT